MLRASLRFSFAFSAFVAFPGQAQQPVLSGADLRARIDSFVSDRVTADAFSGTVALTRHGEIVYQRAAGLANRAKRLPISLDTRLQIASVTKLFTHIAIRQLQQAGKLALSDSVGRFLPRYANPVVRSKVTIEQLLTHRSGLGSFWNDRFLTRRERVRTVNDYLALFQEDTLLFAPGSREAYSNAGYVLLGAIIERVSGRSYHDYVSEHVLRAAGMTSTLTLDLDARPADAAVGYTRMNGVGAGGQRRTNEDGFAGLSSPAGSHLSTAEDFLRLARALTSYRLLDSTHTHALLGERHATGNDFRANGGGPGVNAEFSIYPSGDVLIVLSNYDPPAATDIAQFIRGLIGPTPAPGQRTLGFGIAARPGGALSIVNVVRGSSAEKAGLANGDQLLEFDGVAASAMSPDVVRAAVARGGILSLVVSRDGKRVEVQVQP